jgi:hypothetical protein
MGRAFYTAELPRYANKFTGNQPGANVTPVDVDRNRMLMFDKMYDTPQGQMEGLDYYDMLRRQAMVKPGIGKDMIRQEILDAGFAGTQMPNATGKAYAIYDPSVAQDMSGRGFARGGLVDGSSNDDGTGGEDWRNTPGMAAGGVPYRGINPMATGLGQMRQQSVARDAASSLMAKNRAAQFANQATDRLNRQKQLAAAKTARLAALAPKLSTYVPPASGSTVPDPKVGSTAVPPTNTASSTSSVPTVSAKTTQPSGSATYYTDPATGEAYYLISGPDGSLYRSDRSIPGLPRVGIDYQPNTDASAPFRPKDPLAASIYDSMPPDQRVAYGKNWQETTGSTVGNFAPLKSDVLPEGYFRNPVKSSGSLSQIPGALNDGEFLPILKDDDWYMTRDLQGVPKDTSRTWRDPISGYGISVDPYRDVSAAAFTYYDPQGRKLRSSIFNPDELYKNAQEFGINLSGIGSLGQKLDAAGVSYKPGELYAGTGSDHGINFADIAARNTGDQAVVPPKGARGGLVSMAGGGLAKKAADKAFKALPGQSFQGKSGLNMEMPKDVERKILEITESGLILPSEALGKHEGKTLMITQADRTKVGEGFLGGPGFSGIQLTDPRYAGATWGVKTPGVGQTIIGSNRRVPEGQAIWTTMLGTPTQHKSNQMVFDRLYKEFMGGVKQEKLTPELKDTLNAKLASAIDKEGKNLFPADVDITNPRKFRKLVDTFDKRAAAADVMGGIGVGGKKGQIFDYDRIIQRTTDPALLEVPTGSLGNRLFQLSGEMMDRPDLHPAFPTILKGEDLGVSFIPAPRELLMEDYINKVLTEKGRQPGYMDWTRGYAPSQFLSEELLTKLQKAGYKKGGKVKKMQAGGIAKAVKSGLQALDKPAKQTITSAIDPSTDLASRLTEQGRTSILPIPNRWFLQPEKFPQMQGLVEKVLQVNNMQRSDFPSGAFVNPRTGEILDKRMMEDVGVVIDPKTNRPIMSAKREIETDLSDRKKGSITKSNLVRRQLYKPEGDPLLDELKFIATIEQSGAGHKYGLGTEYATPVEMFNTMTGENPTLRPKSRGDIFGIGDIVGRVTIGKGQPHDVYESLLVAPKGSDVEGVKLSKKKGGMVRRRK